MDNLTQRVIFWRFIYALPRSARCGGDEGNRSDSERPEARANYCELVRHWGYLWVDSLDSFMDIHSVDDTKHLPRHQSVTEKPLGAFTSPAQQASLSRGFHSCCFHGTTVRSRTACWHPSLPLCRDLCLCCFWAMGYSAQAESSHAKERLRPI